jgi:hypothetical protein
MGRGEENLQPAVDAGPEGAELPWSLRWHLGDRESWSPSFSERHMRGLAQALLAGHALEPYVRRNMPDVAQWLDEHTQTAPPSKGWPLLRRAVSLVVAVGR